MAYERSWRPEFAPLRWYHYLVIVLWTLSGFLDPAFRSGLPILLVNLVVRFVVGTVVVWLLVQLFHLGRILLAMYASRSGEG